MRYKNVDNGRVIDIPSILADKKWILDESISVADETTEKKKSVKKKTVKKEG